MVCSLNAGLRPSPACTALVKFSEGYEARAYLDNKHGRVWTIGFGHTRGVKQGDTCTKEQAEAFLLSDLGDAERAIKKAVDVQLTQNQYDALVSFVYNVGPGVKGIKSGFVVLRDGSPSTLLRKINARDFGNYNPETETGTGAAGEFLKWVKDNGVILGGLVTRRKAEAKLFWGGVAR